MLYVLVIACEDILKNIRPDNKIDVALQIQGYQSIEPDIILDELRASRGFCITDSSHRGYQNSFKDEQKNI
jgi:hypothetical protein